MNVLDLCLQRDIEFLKRRLINGNTALQRLKRIIEVAQSRLPQENELLIDGKRDCVFPTR